MAHVTAHPMSYGTSGLRSPILKIKWACMFVCLYTQMKGEMESMQRKYKLTSSFYGFEKNIMPETKQFDTEQFILQ